MVTASYVSPEMQQLHAAAQAAGIRLLNEVGLDPGLDHMSAMKIINGVKAAGGKVLAFSSWCGGLPAPEHSDNPLGYKFSWSPRGALLATLNAARFLRGGKVVEVGGRDLMRSVVPLPDYKGFHFEGIPNRDSLQYIPLYGLEKDAEVSLKDMFRGTVRYVGYCDLMAAFHKLGFFDVSPLKMQAFKLVTNWVRPCFLVFFGLFWSFLMFFGLF